MITTVAITTSISSFAQDESSSFTPGLDIYSSYIWRGSKFGTGAAFQPYLEYSAGGFAIGAWGSVSTGGAYLDTPKEVIGGEGFEMDLYLSYGFDFGLSIALTDYYFGGDWTDFETMHFFEPALSYEISNISLTGAYMIGEDVSDTYLEASYSGTVDLFIGAGDGQYTDDGDFMICNVGIGSSKEIAITDKFSLPLSGSVILNPSTGGFFITAGISF